MARSRLPFAFNADPYGAQPGTADYMPVDGGEENLPYEPYEPDANPPDVGDDMGYLGGSKYFDEKTGRYYTQAEWDALNAQRNSLNAPPQPSYPEEGVVTHGWTGPAAPPTLAMPPASSSSSASSGQMSELVNQKILELLNRQLSSDPATLANSAGAKAFKYGAGRAARRDRAELMERAQLEGWGSGGGVDSELNKIKERRGTSYANFLGEMATQELRDNREMLLQAMNMAQQAGQFDKAQALQLQLAQMDEALRHRAISSQEGIANNNLGFNYTQLQENLNRDALIQALLGLSAAG